MSTQLELLPMSHRSAFQNIRNFLAGRLLGATRDRALVDELFKCVFSKHWLLKWPDLAVGKDLSKSYGAAFAHVKRVLPAIFLPSDETELDRLRCNMWTVNLRRLIWRIAERTFLANSTRHSREAASRRV